MRNIDSIIIHCSATRVGLDFSAANIDQWHRGRGFSGIGYHYVIRLDGKIEKGRDVELPGTHCKGWNERSIGICYIGGLDEHGQPADTRTPAQKRVLYQIVLDLMKEYNITQVLGHRDTSPDLNADGIIESFEFIKACPCFDVKEFMRKGRCWIIPFLTAFATSLMMMGCKTKKDVMKNDMEIRVDSSMEYKKEEFLTEQLATFQQETDVIEEIVEETVVFYPANWNGSQTQDKEVINFPEFVPDSMQYRNNELNTLSLFLQNSMQPLSSLGVKTTQKRRIERIRTEVSANKSEWVGNEKISETKSSISREKNEYEKSEPVKRSGLWFLIIIVGIAIVLSFYFKMRQ